MLVFAKGRGDRVERPHPTRSSGLSAPRQCAIGGHEYLLQFQEPQSVFVRFFHSASVPPVGANRMPYLNPEGTASSRPQSASSTWTSKQQLLANVHELIIEDAPWIFIVHDLNPRALSPKVKVFVHPQSWFVDLTLPWVEK
jgi:peptide/nickel transport system substrate-binding protein